MKHKGMQIKDGESARCFIRNKATLEDIEELKVLMEERAEALKRGNNKLC
ncbi:MAG: hypothetical protein KH116_16060 [Clostridium sp.]|nr:hypothetical protein [Clostridium sp.]